MSYEPNRLSPDTVRDKVLEGEAVLVCAYDDAEKCASLHLTDSIALDDLPNEPIADRQIVFYCT